MSDCPSGPARPNLITSPVRDTKASQKLGAERDMYTREWTSQDNNSELHISWLQAEGGGGVDLLALTLSTPYSTRTFHNKRRRAWPTRSGYYLVDVLYETETVLLRLC